MSFIDSTPIEVCCPSLSHSHRVLEGLVRWEKNSVGWHYGFNWSFDPPKYQDILT
ncbi:MAG: transposase [Prochloraceae cyanobacterium]